MEFSKEERDKICNEYINTGCTRKSICEKYKINGDTFKTWLKRYYPDAMNTSKSLTKDEVEAKSLLANSSYKDMTQKELQIELIKKDIELARLKKNYAVKINDMGEKEYTTFSKKTSQS